MPKIVDLDAELGFNAPSGPRATKTVKLFGKEWTIVCDLNTYALTALTTGEPQAIAAFIDNLIAPEQLDDFRATIAKQPNLDYERFGALINKLVELVAERPTTPPSGSSPGGKSRTSRPRSAGAS